MSLNVRTDGPIPVLELQGRFDAHVAPAVREWFERTPSANLVVNMQRVNFVDSTAFARQ